VRGSGPQLTQEPKLLRPKFHRDEANTSDVAAGPVEIGDEPLPNRVAPGHKDDRHHRGCGLGRERGRGIADDQGYLPAKKVRHQKRQSSLILGRAVLDRDVLALDEPCFLQALALMWCGLLGRNSSTGIAGCCARAANGQGVAAPPSATMNSRRRMRIAM
jgi:hypothetical protein